MEHDLQFAHRLISSKLILRRPFMICRILMKAGGGAMNFFPPIVFKLIRVTQSRTAGGPGDLSVVFPSWERKPILHIFCMC
ncbi:hypothetical protein LENED_006957 [Lentinula edodes]|uniref:Uncharacterized protein n=1 Tax=Lentinula edodes TaxID=5353 RepID=A0A1Q3ED44_LENED|nr:hypothetical protein LENED_006957 [Lentinula edodes]